jgi:SAM-dependent methyltransferase
MPESPVARHPDPVYERGYHSERHKYLIEDDEYFWARAEASATLYFSAEERRARIFEYGCGIGQSIATLANAWGWDVSSEAREVCRRRKIPVYEDLDTVPRGVWDIVLCRHALEHMEDPLGALRVMRRLVTEGGELYLILPKERHSQAGFEPDLNQHLYCWNFRTINNLLHRAGFTPYLNSYNCVLGYRVLLPVRRWAGKTTYLVTARIVGRLARNAELIIRARPGD